jgi:ATP-dependent DNA helicase RecQ
MDDKTKSRLKKYDKILKKYFGYDKLKPLQFAILNTILNEKKDVCSILNTGFGKSITYQLPVLITKKCVIVISPLISLMNDQYWEMIDKNIPACQFNSDTNDMTIKNELMYGNDYKIIYMTPEHFLKCETFVKKLEENNNLSLICLDEAHCVSSWSDFRISYFKLSIIREWTTKIPILTLTATASEKVKKDIRDTLQLRNPVEITGNFNRENLSLYVHKKDDKLFYELLEKYKDEYIFIYCSTRKTTEKLAKDITKKGITCKAYHASLPNKNDIQRDLIDGKFKCIAATIAFGMGINIPKVRLVIHYNCPKNVEGYYQEIGRAGRDGKNSECHLFYASKDFVTNRFFIDQTKQIDHKLYQEEQLKDMEKYIYAKTCRRKILLQNFQQILKEPCNNCDCCLTENVQVDYMKQLYLFLNVLYRNDEKFGSMMTINILLGKEKKVKERMQKYNEFGLGIQFGKEKWWKEFVNALRENEYVYDQRVSGSFGSILCMTHKAKEYLFDIKNKYPEFSEINKNYTKIYFNEIK